LKRKGSPTARIRALVALIIVIITANAPTLITAPTNQQSQQKNNPNITVANAPPQLGNLGFALALGGTNGNITVFLTVSDNVSLSSVKLYYRIVNTTTWNNKTMVLTGAIYNDAPTYNATIGPYAYGTAVNFYVNATDTLGSFTCDPSGAPTTYYDAAVFKIPSGPPGPLPPFSIGWFILVGCFIGAAILIIAGLLLYRRSNKSTDRGKTHQSKVTFQTRQASAGDKVSIVSLFPLR
jgi:hypothetical protein